MNKNSDNIRVLVIDDDKPEVSGIRDFLERDVAPFFVVDHCTSPKAAIHFLKEKTVDIILLDFNVAKQHNAEEIFQKISPVVNDTPLIVFTGEEEHDMALLIMREGAADNITRENFAARPECLKEAIECALTRAEFQREKSQIALESKRKKSDVKRKKFQNIEAVKLKYTHEKEAAALEKYEEKTATTLKENERLTAEALKESNVQYLLDTKYQKQLVSWMSGGYSVEYGDGDLASKNLESMQKETASNLLRKQKQKAVILKEDQKSVAKALKKKHEKEAEELKASQEKETT